MNQEALKLALEGVEIHSPNSPEYIVCAALIEALREHAMREVQRLGQEIEQEPVKYSDYEPDGVHHNKPPQRTWVELTDEEYTHITDTVFHTGQGLVAYYKAIEAKLREKNSQHKEKNT
jgi:hypothetical protein